MWGHDFRPDYLFIRRGLEELGRPTLLGMTATATPETAREIGLALGREPEVVRHTVVRPNLRYEVAEVANAEDRLRILVERLAQLRGGSAIVYARSRRSTEEIARVLRGHGFRADHYHAGLEPRSGRASRTTSSRIARRRSWRRPRSAWGSTSPTCVSSASSNYPDSLEGYVQMVGRAGRDGEPSRDALAREPERRGRTSALRACRTSRPSPSCGPCIARSRAATTIEPESLAAVVPERDPRVLVGMLEQAGLVRRGFDEGRSMRVELTSAPDDAAERVEALLDRATLVAEARADRIVAFAETHTCRHAQVAEHFGETFAAAPAEHATSVRPVSGSATRVLATAPAPRRHRRGDRRERSPG